MQYVNGRPRKGDKQTIFSPVRRKWAHMAQHNLPVYICLPENNVTEYIV